MGKKDTEESYREKNRGDRRRKKKEGYCEGPRNLFIKFDSLLERDKISSNFYISFSENQEREKFV